jgi:hypothetical protein
MKNHFTALIKHLTDAGSGEALLNVNIPGQLRPEEDTEEATARNLNAAFLLALSGDENAIRYINGFKESGIAAFYAEGLKLIPLEVEQACADDPGFEKTLGAAPARVGDKTSSAEQTIERFRKVFFPEGVALCEDQENRVKTLREKRKVTVTRLNASPIENPAGEILFTSNILITTPLEPENIDTLALPSSLRDKLKEVVSEEQLYWYDHPIPVGIRAESNEALYGLRGLDEAVAFEKQRGTVAEGEKLACALSVSVTHRGLQGIAKEYLEEEFKKSGEFPRHLDVYVFTEADTSALIDEILMPAAQKYGLQIDGKGFRETIGVDGEDGRHYTFLKAVSALWQVLFHPEIRGTFKIDLDQVFPQEKLVAQSGASALEHLKTPLWGAEGVDSGGGKVELGMIAGALVNGSDISKSLFCPDVCFPAKQLQADEVVFFSTLPQALSTEAEMMTRYADGGLDGESACIQRIHVTGGTNGILVKSLRRHRPFTPVFIGRAEDQAFILSTLFASPEGNLRYVHKDGLIMRHDKEAFAGEAMRAAHVGKMIGDYARILWFSHYARALPWPVEETKDLIDPFTGCFVSRIPFTLVYLRFALKAASLFRDDPDEGLKFLRMGARRLHEIIQTLRDRPHLLAEEYQKEKQVWNTFYDILDHLEKGIQDGDEFALELRSRAKALVDGCRISLGG